MLDQINKVDLKVNETIARMVLGVGILLVGVGVVFYSLKNQKQQTLNTLTETASQENLKQELTPAASAVALPTTYEIKKGDTLWSISEQFYSSGFNWKDIKSANPNIDQYHLIAGTKITIPFAQSKTITVGTIKPTITPAKITQDTYTVVSGDTLWTIALRAYGDSYRWVDIAKANNLSNPSLIHKGNVLRIPR